MSTSVVNRLFTPGGCVTAQAMRGYLDGTLRLGSRIQVEEHIKKCMFCSEAIRGFKSRSTNQFMMSDVDNLSRKIRRRYNMRPYGSNRRFPLLVIFTLTIFLLLLWAIFYVLHQNILMQKEKENVKPDTTLSTGMPARDTVPLK